MKEFFQWIVDFKSMPVNLKRDLEMFLALRAKKYYENGHPEDDGAVITKVEMNPITFSFIVNKKSRK